MFGSISYPHIKVLTTSVVSPYAFCSIGVALLYFASVRPHYYPARMRKG